MALQIREDWIPCIELILDSPGVTAVVGADDTGKTSFCTLLANRALAAGVSVAVVDGDMGQSEIGPPTTIGLGLVDREVQSLAEVPTRALYFVGSTSPVEHLLPTVTGMQKLAEQARSLGRRLIIADTTGFVRGAMARRLKTYKLQMLAPRHIVALQRDGEAEHFLRLFDTWEGCTVHRLPVSEAAHVKSPTLRAQRRGVRFYEYLLNGRVHELPIKSLATSNTWLNTGSPLEPKLLTFAGNALGTPVLHGEQLDGGVYLVTSGQSERGLDQLQEYFRTRSINVVPASRYLNLLAGLQDDRLSLLSLAIIKSLDFRGGTVSLFTPLRSVTPVKSIVFGDLKVRTDGAEVGRLRPGEQ